MARNVGKIARRIWSCCPLSTRNAIAETCATSSSSTPSSAARPLLRNPSASAQQPFFGTRKQSVHYARLPGEIASISSLMPRHNVTAAARLVSKLSGDLTPEIEVAFLRSREVLGLAKSKSLVDVLWFGHPLLTKEEFLQDTLAPSNRGWGKKSYPIFVYHLDWLIWERYQQSKGYLESTFLQKIEGLSAS